MTFQKTNTGKPIIEVKRYQQDINNEDSNLLFITKQNSVKHMRKKGIPWVLTIFSIIILILFIILCVFFFRNNFCAKKNYDNKITDTWLFSHNNSLLAKFRKATVVSDNELCSEIGRSILMKGGNAVDTAIATAVCIGSLNSHTSGIGGGFLMTFYNRFYGKCSTVDAYGIAPSILDQTNFSSLSEDASIGYKTIAVPGEVYGYWQAYKRFGSGRINWFDLFSPTIQYLTDGFPVSKSLEKNLYQFKNKIMDQPTMRRFFFNKLTNDLYKEGEILKNLPLADTLRQIALSADPIRFFYHSSFSKQFVNEITQNGGFLEQRDLEKYKAIISDLVLEKSNFTNNGDLVMCGAKAPSSFAYTQLIISIMSKFYSLNAEENYLQNSAMYYHRFIEAQKFAYELKSNNIMAKLLLENITKQEFVEKSIKKINENLLLTFNDFTINNQTSQFQSDNYGSSHVSVIDIDGNAVSLTSSINNIFGSMIRSEKTGIIWNNLMNNFMFYNQKNIFAFKAYKTNNATPGKKPISNMSPMIIYNKNTKNVLLSIGASGGPKIVSSIAQIVLQTLLFNSSIKYSIDFPRIHYSFPSLITSFEKKFPISILNKLQEHNQNFTAEDLFSTTVHAIYQTTDNFLIACTDNREKINAYPKGY